jgi:PPE-repeat protein
MGVMNFVVSPPEVNSALMYDGAGSGPMLATAAAWEGLAGELGSAVGSFSSVISGLAGSVWQGPASQAMAAVAALYAQWLNAAAARAGSRGGAG